MRQISTVLHGLVGATLLLTASPRIAVATLPERVSDGLMALYLLDERSGTVVHDLSGFGTPLDLAIIPGHLGRKLG